MNLTTQQKVNLKIFGFVAGLIQGGLAYYFWKEKPHLAGYFVAGALSTPFAIAKLVDELPTGDPSMLQASRSGNTTDVLLSSIAAGSA